MREVIAKEQLFQLFYSCMTLMAENEFSKYHAYSLNELAAGLDSDFYPALLSLIEDAFNPAMQLRKKETQQVTTTEVYTSLCITSLQRLKLYATERKQVVVPYLVSLSEKDTNNHNCENCSGSCQIEHASYINILEDSHRTIKEMLQRLSNVAIPVYADTEYPELYKAVRNGMFGVKTNLANLMFFEETILIPKIIEAQKNIKAFTDTRNL